VSQPDRCKSANDIVVMAWKYAQHLGRTSAERIAVFNFEMTRLERAPMPKDEYWRAFPREEERPPVRNLIRCPGRHRGRYEIGVAD
jgi:hypothetical protein